MTHSSPKQPALPREEAVQFVERINTASAVRTWARSVTLAQRAPGRGMWFSAIHNPEAPDPSRISVNCDCCALTGRSLILIFGFPGRCPGLRCYWPFGPFVVVRRRATEDIDGMRKSGKFRPYRAICNLDIWIPKALLWAILLTALRAVHCPSKASDGRHQRHPKIR
jgi:hypothetical protein